MKVAQRDPPRRFSVDGGTDVKLADCGSIVLEPDEQVTFLTASGAEYDVARKEWGFYATPSINGRLLQFNLRAVLVRSPRTERYFVLLVERGHEPAFDAYLARESSEVVAWLDDTVALDHIRAAVAERRR